jgi:hypothetical protein
MMRDEELRIIEAENAERRKRKAKATEGRWEKSRNGEPAEIRTEQEFIELLRDGSRPKRGAKPYKATIYMPIAGLFGGTPWERFSKEDQRNADFVVGAKNDDVESTVDRLVAEVKRLKGDIG